MKRKSFLWRVNIKPYPFDGFVYRCDDEIKYMPTRRYRWINFQIFSKRLVSVKFRMTRLKVICWKFSNTNTKVLLLKQLNCRLQYVQLFNAFISVLEENQDHLFLKDEDGSF